MEAKITFKDGTIINAEMNGNCFIKSAKPTFPEDLSVVTVETADQTYQYQNAIVQECAPLDSNYWWCFVEKDPRDVEIQMLEDAILELAEIIGGE